MAWGSRSASNETGTTGTVSAVRTTGIYCRAGCSGRPKPENTSRYRSGVAAEAAGYRACLKCRPERSAASWPAAAAPRPVEAALLLIADGCLDSHTEAELAARVGYSARQLRRVFVEHVGATPDFVARSRRAHFGRRLIDDTDLEFGDVAAAAGFGSVRQFHRVITEVFGFAPRDLRARRRRGERPRIDGGLRLLVPCVAPYDFGRVLDHLRARAIPGVECVSADAYRRSISVCGHPGVAEVADAGDGAHLALTLHLPAFDCVIDDVQRCRRLFATDEDPRPAARRLGADPALRRLVRRRPGLRVPRCWDRFETVVRIIVGQQVSVRGASTLAGRIAAAAGEPFDSGVEAVTHTFPGAHDLAGHDLDGLGLTQRRRATLRAVAAAVAAGDIDLASAASTAEIEAQWCAVDGIGPWTAQLIAMRVYGHDDAWPAGDLGLRRSLDRLHGGASGTDAAPSDVWRPFRSWAAQHLWSADGSPAGTTAGSAPGTRTSPPTPKQKAGNT